MWGGPVSETGIFVTEDRVGNRLSEQIGNTVTTSSHSEKNQLLGRSAGGPLRWRGTLSEAENVTFTSALVNGKPARMLSGNVFEAILDTNPGTNTVTVEARDISGNVTTKKYRVNVSGSGETLTYDASGNLETKTEGADTWRYQWNAENQLVRVEKNGVEAARYAYDPLGRRVEKIENGVSTAYLYDGEDILRESRSGGAVLRYIHGPGVDEALAQADGAGNLSFLQADGLGSVVATTNATGTVVSTARYDAWGVPEAGVPSFGFTGRERDAAADLWYYRARYYDPKVGRFISEDPIGFEGGINFYAYVENNPANATDPYGLASIHLDPGPRPQPPTGSTSVLRWWWFHLQDDMWRSRQDPVQMSLALPGPAMCAAPIGGVITGFTKHGVNSVISHPGGGVSPSAVLRAVRNPVQVVNQAKGVVQFVGPDATVVLNAQGKVITAWPTASSGARCLPCR